MRAKEVIDQLGRFQGSSKEFLANLLAVEAAMTGAEGGAVLRANQQNSVDVLSVYPQLEQGAPPPAWLTQSVQLALNVSASGGTVAAPLKLSDPVLSSEENKHYIVMTPLLLADTGRAVAAFRITAEKKSDLEISRQHIELISRLMGNADLRLLRGGNREDLKRLQQAMETVSSMNREIRFKSAAMAFCNEVASQWQCERVSLGFLKGRYVQVQAMSHTEDFNRKMEGIQDLEAAMEECLDQDVEIFAPAPQDATYISRATRDLARRDEGAVVVSLPLRFGGETIGVLTLQRPAARPFTQEETEAVRLACELCTARLHNLFERDRWFGAKAAAKTRKALSALVGPEHTWAKLTAIVCAAALVFLLFVKGEFRVKAPFTLESIKLQVVPAPFDGHIKDVVVEVGNEVTGGETVLATLDTAELKLQLAEARADQTSYLKQASAAMRDGKTAQAQIAQANAEKAQARLELLQYHINQASLIAPIDGIVVKGDLKKEIGAPVQTGDVLFEVTPLKALRAELMVPEEDVLFVEKGQKGFLATASYPQRRINFTVERINPVAEVAKQRNVFKVRVQLEKEYQWLRPGMEGVAKVSIDDRSYLWIWTRKILNWIRMQLWF